MDVQYKQARTIDYVFRGCRVILTELTRQSDGYRIEAITVSEQVDGVAVADRYVTIIRYDFKGGYRECAEVEYSKFTAAEADVIDHHREAVGKIIRGELGLSFEVQRRDDLREREETSMLPAEWRKTTVLTWRGRTVEVLTKQVENVIGRYQTTVKEGGRRIEESECFNADEKEAKHEAVVERYIAILARFRGSDEHDH